MLKSLVKPVLLAIVIVASAFGQDIAVAVASPASPIVTATGSTISVSGTASGGTGITRVAWQTSDGATGVASGVASWVATGIPVTRGTSTIFLRAFDSTGASAWVAVVAVRP